MMRIKEAIQRKKLIHEMNEEWKDFELDGTSTPLPTFTENEKVQENEGKRSDGLQNFVQYLNSKLNEYQKRALKVTWKRLSEAPKTSGRGTIHIMEKVLSKMCEKEPAINAIFYKSAFLSCIEDRRCGRTNYNNSISTIRDHAHILVEFVNGVFQCMFDGVVKEGYDPESIGASHCKLMPLGFERRMWHVLGECFAEVMFNQECIRAYPHAPSAWSLLAVTMTDKMYAASRPSSVRRDHSTEAPQTPRSARMNNFVSPPASVSNSSEEVFHTARTEFPERRCPFVHQTSSSIDVPRQLARESRTEYRNRFNSQQPGNEYFQRKHPILIPRPLFGRSQSEVRFSSVPMPAPAMPIPTKTSNV